MHCKKSTQLLHQTNKKKVSKQEIEETSAMPDLTPVYSLN